MECGACCAAFRVSFYWTEADDAGGRVPAALTQPLPPHRACMTGTNSDTPLCAALEGEVGAGVRCAIYDNRPSTCREFMPHGENGEPNAFCTRARAKFGLPPLEFTKTPGIEHRVSGSGASR